ncbi:MAG: AAA family ATPase [Phycisphaerales bacterium]|nr:AAA family ATPase [Phycisphaerales bacterium]
MYANAFGLRILPFNNAPDPRLFYSTPDHEEALATLVYVIGELKGLALLTGESGTGKSFLARLMLDHFASRIHPVRVAASPWTCPSLFISVCRAFNVLTDANQRLDVAGDHLREQLIQNAARRRPAVLVVDDAHLLPDDAFESLRALTTLENGGAPLLQVVLLGTGELRRRLDSPVAESMRNRVYRACTLRPLNREQTAGFIRHRLAAAGAPCIDLFDESAIDAIFQLARGIPQRVNIVADNVLLSAYARDIRLIDAAFVRSLPDLTLLVDRSAGDPACHDPLPPGRVEHRDRSHRRRTRPANTRSRRADDAGFDSRDPAPDSAVDHRLNEMERKLARLAIVYDALSHQRPSPDAPTVGSPDRLAQRLDDLQHRMDRMDRVDPIENPPAKPPANADSGRVGTAHLRLSESVLGPAIDHDPPADLLARVNEMEAQLRDLVRLTHSSAAADSDTRRHDYRADPPTEAARGVDAAHRFSAAPLPPLDTPAEPRADVQTALTDGKARGSVDVPASTWRSIDPSPSTAVRAADAALERVRTEALRVARLAAALRSVSDGDPAAERSAAAAFPVEG